MRAPTLAPSPGSRCSTSGGTPASSSILHGARRDERRLLGRLREHRVAGSERRRDLSGEDRERKIPRADADEHAATAQPQLVALARRARQAHAGAELGCARDRRSSAGNRRPRALRKCCPESCGRLRARRTRSAPACATRTDRRRARALRRARSPASCPSPAAHAPRRRMRPRSQRSSASVTVPMTSLRFAGLRTSARAAVTQLARRRSAPPSSARARHARRSRRTASYSKGSGRLTPLELSRDEPYSMRGGGMRGCAFCCSASTSAPDRARCRRWPSAHRRCD